MTICIAVSSVLALHDYNHTTVVYPCRLVEGLIPTPVFRLKWKGQMVPQITTRK